MYCLTCGRPNDETAAFCHHCGEKTGQKPVNVTKPTIAPKPVVESKPLQLMAATCPNCGANIRLDMATRKGVCNFCNSEIFINENNEPVLKRAFNEISEYSSQKFEEYAPDGVKKIYRNTIDPIIKKTIRKE
ncbi:MAG: zinc ribbon domain-containing protein [Oscillospiraceae bacterium]|nr:zinc ribbon domain-containing protein [Oscillospiraceae bacterium]